MAMGRKPSAHLNLPPKMRSRTQKSGKVYYYYEVSRKPHKEIPLGDDYARAMKQWSELEIAALPSNVEVVTFKYAAGKYFESPNYMDDLQARTQKDYKAYSVKVYEFFNEDPPVPMDSIKPMHIQQFMEWRKEAKSRANRERAFISLVWNYARSVGLTEKPNPCQGVKGYTEEGRDIYIEDDIQDAVIECATQPLKDAMDLAYLVGQRPADTLKMAETDIKSGCLEVQQGKTKNKLRVVIEGPLKYVLERIANRKKGYKVRTLRLVVNESGRPVSYAMLWDYFDEARTKAITKFPNMADDIKAFQFRDLRAKAITDKSESTSPQEAQKLAGHSSITTTDGYIRYRKGQKVTPTK